MVEMLTVKKRTDDTKYLIVPKHSGIEAGEKVLVTNNLTMINKFVEEEKNARKRKEKTTRKI